MWGYAVIVLGILAIGVIWFFANTTRTDQHNYNLLKETTEAAMLDAVDLAAYRKDGTVRIEEEKFVENFIRRFAENADLSNTYRIEIYDVNEEPPKVSLRVLSTEDTTATGDVIEFDIVNNIDAILETKYSPSADEYEEKLYGNTKIMEKEGEFEIKCTSNSFVTEKTIPFSNEYDLVEVTNNSDDGVRLKKYTLMDNGKNIKITWAIENCRREVEVGYEIKYKLKKEG